MILYISSAVIFESETNYDIHQLLRICGLQVAGSEYGDIFLATDYENLGFHPDQVGDQTIPVSDGSVRYFSISCG